MKRSTHFGSRALMATLALGGVATSAETIQEGAGQPESRKREIELVEVHGIRTSVYSVKASGDSRRLGDLMDQAVTITVM